MSVGQHYDVVTQAWTIVMGDDLHWGLFSSTGETLSAATSRLTDEMASLAQLQPSEAVVDLGCGTGGPALRIAERHGVTVTGLTLSPVGAALAKERASVGGVEGLDFVVGDAQASGLPDQVFECAWVMESSHLMPDKGSMLAEAHRVLRPDGRLVLCDLILPRSVALAEVLSRGREYSVLHRVFGRAKMETLSTYESMAEAAGFVDVATQDITNQVLPTIQAWRENLLRQRAQIVGLMGTARYEAFFTACDVLESHTSEGLLGYGLLFARRPK